MTLAERLDGVLTIPAAAAKAEISTRRLRRAAMNREFDTRWIGAARVCLYSDVCDWIASVEAAREAAAAKAHAEEAAKVAEILTQLSPRLRELAAWRWGFDGTDSTPVAEIALQRNVTPSAVRYQLLKIRRRAENYHVRKVSRAAGL